MSLVLVQVYVFKGPESGSYLIILHRPEYESPSSQRVSRRPKNVSLL